MNMSNNYWNRLSSFFADSDNEKVSAMANKVNKTYKEYNPFLDRNGKLLNKHINYQQLLDNDKINDTTKNYITKATGLTPSARQDFGGKLGKGTAITNINLPASDSNILSSAEKYIGTPYVWGGDGIEEGGMDCSGFVYSSLKDAGYDIGRTTAQGYRNYGTAINKADMQPGDLVFFGKNGNATHVGIYAGNGQMIHSSGGKSNTKSNPGKGVSVTNLDYRNDFIEARRF